MTTDPLVGKTLGPCRLEALAGAGGMGRVYRARHLTLDRVVAVKLVDRVLSGGAGARAAVLAEARAAAKLDDPRVVAVYDAGEDQGVAYLVMQWVDGEDLERRVARAGPLPPAEALRVVREVAAALKAAHAAGLVHRDVKPGNILLDARGGVKLSDFGLALAAGGAGETSAAGSAYFMAPEQAYGTAPQPASDFYALGATWYYALTGRPPFPGSAADALVRHRDEAPPDVRALRPEVTTRAADLLRRLMAKDPAGRPGADALLAELASAGMTLDTDASGSPFRLVPAKPEDPRGAGPAPAARAPLARLLPPPPPPPPPPMTLGSTATFYLIGGVMGGAAASWPWRGAVTQDWLAGVVFLAAFPALLTFGDRAAAWRRAAGPALWLGAAACFARWIFPVRGASPPLETWIAVGLGAGASAGAVYLGLWGADAEETAWARGLAPLGGLLWAAAALTWGVPDGGSWSGTLASEGGRALSAWIAGGGPLRWGALLALLLAAAGARAIKRAGGGSSDRRLNWNR
jgi:hypothetical protein